MISPALISPRPLSIYRGDNTPDDGSPLSLDSTTSDLYWRHARPKMRARGTRPRNLEAYESALKHWVALTGDPPLRAIDDETCTRFVLGLAALPGRRGETMAANSIRKYCVAIESIWKWAGPRVKACPHALKLFGAEPLPWFDPPDPEQTDDEARWFSLDEVRAIVTACQVATAPVMPPIPPWLWWQSLVRTAYYTGLRIGSLLALRYDWIRGDELVIPAASMKKRRAFRQHLHPAAIAALAVIRTRRVVVFYWPHTSRTLYRHFARILDAAGMGTERHPPKFHGLRRAHGDGLGQVDMDAAELSLGHLAKSTTARYVQTRGKVARAIDALPII
jgi:hypothetical protein